MTSLAPAISAKPQLQRSYTFCAGSRQTEFADNDGRYRLLSADGVPSTANPNLSTVEVEQKLRERLKFKHNEVLQAFQSYDVDRTLSISKGELRRVLEVHCLLMTAEQFDAILNKADVGHDGTVRYSNFLDKFCADNSRRPLTADGLRCSSAASRCQSAESTPSVDVIEKLLQEKIQSRLSEVLVALRLYEYNRDGSVHSKHLHRVLDRHCFSLSDKQFDRIYQKHDFRRNGIVNYRDFLTRLGVRLDTSCPSTPQPTVVGNNSVLTGKNTPKTQKVSKAPVTDAELYEIEVDFRKKVRENYGNLKRMFLAFDRHLDGFISIDDLRAILHNFTFSMTDEIFTELMMRFGFKATGKISWEFFLGKFQDPLADRNGQTIPIKRSHKYFPNRGVDEQMNLKQVAHLLLKHIRNHYSTLKNAFLEMDKNRDGSISRGELRQLLEKTSPVRLRPEHVKALMNIVDPQHTNAISYHKFLRLFEERESVASHKWLNSCHRFNIPKSAIVAWSTLENDIREKMEANRADLVSALERRDPQCTGQVSERVLRKVMEKFALPVTDDHFKDMLSRHPRTSADNAVNYTEFFQSLGVTLKPTDSSGISSQIIANSQNTAAEHLANQLHRSTEIDQRAMDRACQMEIDEIIVRLKDKMSQRTSDLYRAFRLYAARRRDRITRRDFRQMLDNFAFNLSDEQFEQLCAALSFTNGPMRLTQFMENFEQRRPRSPTSHDDTIKPKTNHVVNVGRGDEYGLTADEVDKKLRDKLRENFQDLHDAFSKFDADNDGILTKLDFRRMLDSFMLTVTDDEFEFFCQRLGISTKSRITYEDFLAVFQLRETKAGHAWLQSVHRFNETKPAPKLTADEGHDIVMRKLHEMWHDVAKAFRSIASQQHGVIRKSDLRRVLDQFAIHLESDQFSALWARFDVDGKGFVDCDHFVDRLMADEFTPGDRHGVSRRIINDNREELKKRQEDHIHRLEENQLKEAHHVSTLSPDSVLTNLRERMQDQFTDLQAAFWSVDTNNKGYLTSRDFLNLLGRLNILIDDDQLFDLLERVGLSSPRSRLSFDRFVSIFEEGRAESFKLGELEDAEYPQVKFESLSCEEVEARLRRRVAEQYDVLLCACQSFDRQQTGLMAMSSLRRVIDNFCFKMTDSHFRHMMSVFSCTRAPYSAPFIDYRKFLQTFKDDTQTMDTQKMVESLQELMAINNCDSLEELEMIVRDRVARNERIIRRAFADADFAGLGVVSKNDFCEVLNTHAVSLTSEQFEKLSLTLPINEFSNVDYEAFILQCTGQRSKTAAKAVTSERRLPTSFISLEPRPPSTASSRLGSATSSRRSSKRPFTPLVNAESSESKLRDVVRRHWRSMQNDFRAQDTDGLGHISQHDFNRIAQKYNLELTDDELFKLLLKYDLKNNDQFCYPDFLRHFLLEPADDVSARSSLLRRSTSRPNVLGRRQKTVEAREGVDLTVADVVNPAMEQLRDCVRSNWKQMRRELVNTESPGLTTESQLRQTLRNANADLDELQFADIVDQFKDHRTGKIRYDDFFRYYFYDN